MAPDNLSVEQRAVIGAARRLVDGFNRATIADCRQMAKTDLGVGAVLHPIRHGSLLGLVDALAAYDDANRSAA